MYVCLHSSVLWNCKRNAERQETGSKGPHGHSAKDKLAPLQVREVWRMEQVCRSLPMRASCFVEVVQVSCFPPKFSLEGFQACVEISGAIQAHLCGPYAAHVVNILPHLSHLSVCMFIISGNRMGIIDTAINNSAPMDEDILLQNHCMLTTLRK